MSAIDLWVFLPLAALAVMGAIGLVASRNPIHCALFLMVNLLALAALFLALSAPVLAALQVIVYAGAIMVLFVFVILFFTRPGQVHTVSYSLPLMYPLGAFLAVMVIGVILFALYQGGLFHPVLPPPPTGETPSDVAAPVSLGRELFSRYLLPFELTSVLLLVAMLGAVVMARRDPRDSDRDASSKEETS